MDKIKFFIMDVDGTLTDGRIYMGNDGELMKAFNIKDGYGIHDILPCAGITPVIITGRESEIVTRRCKEIGIHRIYQRVDDKVEALKSLINEDGVSMNEVAYIGDDINDLSVMLLIKKGGGKTGCPSDAVPRIIAIADYVADHRGGEGAVRDYIEWLISKEEK